MPQKPIERIPWATFAGIIGDVLGVGVAREVMLSCYIESLQDGRLPNLNERLELTMDVAPFSVLLKAKHMGMTMGAIYLELCTFLPPPPAAAGDVDPGTYQVIAAPRHTTGPHRIYAGG